MIEETETMWLLDIPGISVCEDSEVAQSVNQANRRYSEVGIIIILVANLMFQTGILLVPIRVP